MPSSECPVPSTEDGVFVGDPGFLYEVPAHRCGHRDGEAASSHQRSRCPFSTKQIETIRDFTFKNKYKVEQSYVQMFIETSSKHEPQNKVERGGRVLGIHSGALSSARSERFQSRRWDLRGTESVHSCVQCLSRPPSLSGANDPMGIFNTSAAEFTY